MKPSNDYEALVLALTLAVSAPSDEQAKKCIEMAETISGGLSEIEVERAKKQALQNLDEEAKL